MKIAVSASGQDLDGAVDPRFGRCDTLMLIDTETGEATVHGNELNMRAAQGAGIQTAKNVSELGAEAVITGNIGPKAFKALSTVGIKVYLFKEGTIQQALDAFKAGELQEQTDANVEGHWI